MNIKNHYDDAPNNVILRISYGSDCVKNCFKLLVEYGADVNVQNEYGMTPLSTIIIYRIDNDLALDVTEILLDANADLNIQIKSNITKKFHYLAVSGDTALHIAVRKGKIKFLSMILKYHPNLSIINQVNDTVLDIATKLRSYEIVELITKEFRNQMYKYLLYRWLP